MVKAKAVKAKELTQFIEESIPDFHAARLARLKSLKLTDLLRSKNPYLFRAKNILVAADLVKNFLSAHLSSGEETIFGTFLERLAVFVATKVWGAKKSAAEGIDLELEQESTLFLLAIKSGPDWGNSSQIARMLDNFRKATKIVRTNAKERPVRWVNGCCYGRTSGSGDKGDYMKLCGQSFWHFISNEPEMYRGIIEPLGHQSQSRNDVFGLEFAKVVNQFTGEMIKDFCHADGEIDWDKLVRFNSERKK